jgi:inner membrane protein
MPSPIAHSVTGYALFRLFKDDRAGLPSTHDWKFYLYIFFISNAADLDFIPQLITGGSYHHGFTHSICFSLLFSVVVGFIFHQSSNIPYKHALSLTLIIYVSHVVADYFTAGGGGVELFWPFYGGRFISPLTVFPETHHGKKFLHRDHLFFLGFELSYLILVLAGLSLRSYLRIKSNERRPTVRGYGKRDPQ